MKNLKKKCTARIASLQKVILYEAHILSGAVPESSGTCQQPGTKHNTNAGCVLPKACATKACKSCK